VRRASVALASSRWRRGWRISLHLTKRRATSSGSSTVNV